MTDVQDAYRQWFYSARDPKTGLPFATSLIYGPCQNDPHRFAEAERIMQAAFEGGMSIAQKTEEAPPHIVREEVAEDEMRRQEAAPKLAPDAAVPGGLNPRPGTIFLSGRLGRVVSHDEFFAKDGQ
ncbi:hypothetical protein C1T17_16335 [Sphingobium sp. SCG-1]|uniref:hypothetical protein n=1 Tax=Sphingobium sp. SCG-1 TaxID=2072936 RepID=UPI000CD68580|nr:hypothetical protein [Sphingobium sp. SCG-1]AUW59421.1 hypothetical protein C1T17_16335 [Sphingobium sp. SCG-1]